MQTETYAQNQAYLSEKFCRLCCTYDLVIDKSSTIKETVRAQAQGSMFDISVNKPTQNRNENT